MSAAPERAFHLTPAQKKVLAHIQMCRDSRDRLIQSTREIAEGTGLSQRSVLRALELLNALEIIWTNPGSRNRSGEHILLLHGSVQPGRDANPLMRAGGRR